MSDISPLRWPPRKNTSRADQFKLQHQELRHNYNVEGQTKIFFSWDELLEHRPLDIPLYTAPEGPALIAVLLSNQSMSIEALRELCDSRRPFGLHAQTFEGGGYPILRVNLLLPDNPASPLWLESPLDVRDGDAQDFVDAVIRDERHFQLVLAHEDDTSDVSVLAVSAPGMAAALAAAAQRAIEQLPHGAGDSERKAAVAMMEQVFPRACDGLDPKRIIRVSVIGEVLDDDETDAESRSPHEQGAEGELEYGGLRYRVFASATPLVAELSRVRHAALLTTRADVSTLFQQAFAGVSQAFGADSSEAHALVRSNLFCGQCGSALPKATLMTMIVPYTNVPRPTTCPNCGGDAIIVLTDLDAGN